MSYFLNKFEGKMKNTFEKVLLITDSCGQIRPSFFLNWDMASNGGIHMIAGGGPLPEFAVAEIIRKYEITMVCVLTHALFPRLNCCAMTDAFRNESDPLHAWAITNLTSTDPYDICLTICKRVKQDTQNQHVFPAIVGLVLDQASMRLSPLYCFNTGKEIVLSESKWKSNKNLAFASGIPGIGDSKFWPLELQKIIMINSKSRMTLSVINKATQASLRLRRIVIMDRTVSYPPEAIPLLWKEWGLNGPNTVGSDQYNMVTWGTPDCLNLIAGLLRLRNEIHSSTTDFIIVSDKKVGADDILSTLETLPEFNEMKRDQFWEGCVCKFIAKF
jgi:hypothetical protein